MTQVKQSFDFDERFILFTSYPLFTRLEIGSLQMFARNRNFQFQFKEGTARKAVAAAAGGDTIWVPPPCIIQYLLYLPLAEKTGYGEIRYYDKSFLFD